MENKEEKVTSSNSEKLKKIVDEEKKSKKKNKDSELEGVVAKKLKHGTMATALTCVFLAVLVLLNVVTTVLFERYPINIDLTRILKILTSIVKTMRQKIGKK